MKSDVWIFAAAMLFAGACGERGREQRQPAGDRGVSTAKAGPGAQKTCGVSDTTHLTGAGIGRLRIGATLAEIRENCVVLADTFEADAEAMSQRVLRVGLHGEPVRAVIAQDRIWRIEVDGRTFRTGDALGVGVTLPTLAAQGEATAFEGDGLLYALLPRHCGLSFRLAYRPGDPEHRSTWTAGNLRRLPSVTAVDQVLITGCERTTERETPA